MYIFKAQLVPVNVGVGVLTSAAVIHRFLAAQSCRVRRIAFTVSTATVSSGSIVVTFKLRPTVGSSSGESTIGTLTIPTAVVAGKTYYKEVTPVAVPEGQEVVAEVTTAAAGGGAAGGGISYVIADEDPETAANLSSFVASA